MEHVRLGRTGLKGLPGSALGMMSFGDPSRVPGTWTRRAPPPSSGRPSRAA